MADTSPARLLIVDDEASQMRALCLTLEDAGYAPTGFTSPRDALEALHKKKFDLLLTDLMMPEMDGIALLHAALEVDGDLVVVLMTGHGTIPTVVEAMKTGALDYILKPFNLSVILPVLDRAMGVRRLRVENAALAKRIAERTSKLETANKELEAFSYSISHDLRTPLRHIDGFARLLAAKSPNLQPEAQHYIKNILDGTERMGQLIDDLLMFSRLGRQPLAPLPVDLSALVEGVLEDLRREDPDRKIEVCVGDLPICVGDPSLLTQVLANLLSNAFKFTRKKADAKVEIGWRQEGTDSVYFVRDNGAGFDMQYAKKLFGVFQRLHRVDEFEGTGVGLSIVQRIIQRHGGRVWAEAAPNEGATFYFTLPTNPA